MQWDILTFLWKCFIKWRKNENRSILNDVIDSLNVIDSYLIYISQILNKYLLKFLSHILLLDVHRIFSKTGKEVINIPKFQKVEFFSVCVIQFYIHTYLFLKLFFIICYYKILTTVLCYAVTFVVCCISIFLKLWI